MKKMLLILVITLQFASYSQTATAPSAGSGTSTNPYQIATLNNLYWIANYSSRWNYYYIQTADIDASSTSTWFSGAGWIPIGNSTTKFTGVYNGNGHKISGLYINRTATNYVGLFGYLYGAEVNDLILENAHITGNARTGCISGQNENSLITNCSAFGILNGTYYVGGLIGYNLSSRITQCIGDVAVTGTGTVGGLVGLHYYNSSIENSFSSGSASGTGYVGGMAGGVTEGCSIINCYSTGSVSGSSYTGGLVGNNTASTVTNSFWDTETSGQASSAGGTGKTTVEMKTLTTFTDAGWDISNEAVNGLNYIWGLKSIYNGGYPYLYWQFPQFTEVNIGLQPVWYSSSDWGDYDNDGDLDIVISGYYGNSSNGFAAIYSNDNGTFTNINAGLIGLMDGSVQWGDYDNDGDLDILLIGRKPYENGYAYIYRNDSGIFTNINAGLTGVQSGTSAWGDYDNDGDLDILLSGDTGATDISIIYRNNSGVFTDINAGLTPVGNSSVAWVDYDSDGDNDILLSGYNFDGGYRISKIYRNDSGVFSDINAGLTGVEYGSSDWGDYDNDGDLDLVLTGYTKAWPDYIGLTKIYKNDSGIFNDINAGLQPVGGSSVGWGDYDNDGDLDILITGKTGSLQISNIYRNDNGMFTDINAGFTKVVYGSSSWGDYDNDGDLDILLTGYTGTAGVSKLYRNNSIISNTVPASPSNLESFVDSTSVEVNWNIASDNETPQFGLSYNIYVRPVNQNYYRMSPMSDRDSGCRKIARTGNTGKSNHYTIRDLPDGRYTWSVQAVDHAFAGSAFAPAQSFTVGVVPDLPEVPVALEASHKGINTFKANWTGSTGAEFYNLDVATDTGFTTFVPGYNNLAVGNVISFTVTGLEMDTIYYYRVRAANAGGSSTNSNTISISTGYSSFTDVSANIPGTIWGDVAWGDYDNDGDLDLYKNGHLNSSEMSWVYRNDSGIFTDIHAGIPGIKYGSADWGDYDNDGDLDLLLTGDIGTSISRIYRNDSGAFTDINAGLQGTVDSDAKWGDYDNDGDLDIVLSGSTTDYPSSSTPFTKIYRNEAGKFIEIEAGIVPLYRSSTAWGDYDNDSDLDLLLTGYTGSVKISKIYRNDNGIFTDINAGLTGVSSSSAAWGDYDSDGDLDILLDNYIYRNDSGSFVSVLENFMDVYSNASWGDFDNDGDLDVIMGNYSRFIIILQNCDGEFIDAGIEFANLQGYDAVCGDYDADGDLDIICCGEYTTKLYKNNRYTPNAVPSSPSNLSSSVNGSEVTLSWLKATDTETPQGGLAYNIYIGDWREKINVKSPMSNILSGYRKIVTKGNAGQSESWKINDLPDGKYYWSVQAVDNNFAGSQFADEQTFIVGEVQVVPDPPIALEETEMTESSFKANWNAVSGAEGYYIDIAYDALFTNFVPGYQNKDVENPLILEVTGFNTLITCYYRVRGYNYAGTSGSSNVIEVKRESSGTIAVTSPDGGEIMTRGGQFEIKWSDNIAENVKIDIYKYNEFLDCITESTPSDGSFTWSIPLSLYGGFFKIRITSVEYAYVYDISDGYFVINQNQNNAKLLEEQTFTWNSTTSDWNEFPSKKVINYNGDLVDSWEFQYYNDSLGVFVTNDDNTYNCTYYSDHYRLVNYYSQWIYPPDAPSQGYVCETTDKYSLNNVFLAKYIHRTYWYSSGPLYIIIDKIYTYLNDKIDRVTDHTVFNDVTDKLYQTFYIYDIFERITNQNYFNYLTSETEEITNWTYFSGIQRRAEVLTEKIESASWINKSKRILSYDTSDRIRRDELFNWTNGAWKESTIDSSYYYDDGRLRRTVQYYYDSNISSYKNSEKIDYIYDDPSLGIDTGIKVSEYCLFQNYPNPFNPVTTISYALPKAAQVELNIFNMNGQLVQSLVNGRQEKGIHKAEFNAGDLTSGLYIYNLKADGKVVQSRKMMLIK